MAAGHIEKVQQMAGRPPYSFALDAGRMGLLKTVLRDKSTPPQAVARARILLSRAQGLPIQRIARQLGHDRTTVWRVCERYRARGLDALYDAAHPGRPRGSTKAKSAAARTERTGAKQRSKSRR